MYGGKLQKVRFKFCGNDVEPILDRLPTAKIIDKDDEGYIITAEVFGEGIYMWVRRQGELIKDFEKSGCLISRIMLVFKDNKLFIDLLNLKLFK